jgi:two-component system C4-dicarboxylate transport sensor histidine kinase DctB
MDLHAEAKHDPSDENRLADLGEMAGFLGHEFNNFLNSVLLQLAILQHKLPPSFHGDLAEMQRQGKRMANLVRHLHQYRRDRRSSSQPLDVNEVVRDVAGEWKHTTPLTVKLADEPLQILGTRSDVRRLCSFLLRNAAAAMAPGEGAVSLETAADSAVIRLRVEDTGPSVAEDELVHLFDASQGRAGTSFLELAACASLARRLEGTIQAANRSEGGLTIRVDIPALKA